MHKGPTRRISALAMTAKDHKAIGSTPPEVLAANPDKKWHQTMDKAVLRAYLAEGFLVTSAQYRSALGGDQREAFILKRARDTFVLDLAYLRDIGRLPEELADLDPETVFQLPKKTTER